MVTANCTPLLQFGRQVADSYTVVTYFKMERSSKEGLLDGHVHLLPIGCVSLPDVRPPSQKEYGYLAVHAETAIMSTPQETDSSLQQGTGLVGGQLTRHEVLE